MLTQEFLFTEPPTPSCHASTLVETTARSLLAAWFGGKEEGASDVGIWLARREASGWARPVRVAFSGEVPCWNPVLHQLRRGPLLLFYRMGPSPQTWTAYMRRSTDDGRTWSEPQMLPSGVQGPVRNKPLELSDGTLLCGSSAESYRCWDSWLDRSPDGGRNWTKQGPIHLPGHSDLIQPALVQDGRRIIAFCRTRGLRHVARAVSEDRGLTWKPAELIDVPQNNSGLDAVRLRDGRVVLIYNHHTAARTPLNLAVTGDYGHCWTAGPELESAPGEYSYPAIIQAADGMIHFTYTWRRERIRYGRCRPEDLPQPVHRL